MISARRSGCVSARPIARAGLVLALALGTASVLDLPAAHAQAIPVVRILGPTDHAVVLRSSVLAFYGTAQDAQDGSFLSFSMSWSSSLDGTLSSSSCPIPACVSLPGGSLSLGTHVITASATGRTGLTGSASITIHVIAAGNTSPVVFFSDPRFGTADGASFVTGEAVRLSGNVSDAEDGFNASALVWSSDRDGPLGTGPFRVADNLSVGTHTITASTTDRGGLTATRSFRVIIAAAPLPLPTVDSIRLVNDRVPLTEPWEWSFDTTNARTVTIQVNHDGVEPSFPFPEDRVDGVRSSGSTNNTISEGATIIVTATNSTGSATAQVRATWIRPAHRVITTNTTLTGDHVGTIEIAADDVTLDGNGFKISHALDIGVPYVLVNRAKRATIKNCVIQGDGGHHPSPRQAGIILASSEDSVIENVTIRAVGLGVGFVTDEGDPPNSGHRISSVTIEDAIAGIADNLSFLFILRNGPTSGIVVEETTITDVLTGIAFWRASSGNIVRDNVITDAAAFGHVSPFVEQETPGFGVSITSGNGNSVERNVVSGALEHRSFGIQVSGSGNRIAGNTVSGFREAGVDVNGDASEVHDNVVTGIVWNPPIGVGGHGFNLSGANASIVGNRADDNSGIGFRFRNLSGSVVQANHACGNGVLDSVSAGLSGPANTFVDNTFCVSAQTSPLFLHVQGTSLSLDASAPTDVTVDFRDSASLKFAQFNESKTIGIWTGPPSESPRTLVELSDLRIWLGLKNSDDQGTRFNVYAEVLKNGMQATFGSVRCVSGVTRNAARALEVRVPFYPVPIWNSHFGPSDVLSLRISASIGTDDNGNFCGGHANATGLRLYFDAASRPAAFEALFIPD